MWCDPASYYYPPGVINGRQIGPYQVLGELGRGAVIISAERLSNDPGWDPVPPNEMVVVGGGLTVGLLPMEL